MKQKKWPVRLLSGGLVTLALAGIALAAGQQGSQSDPLITLSYLEEQFAPGVLAQLDSKIAARETQLEEKLAAVKAEYVEEVEDKLAASGGSSAGQGGAESAVYEVVTLAAGQTLTGEAACEVLLRSGTALCVSDSAPGLVDMTDGSTLAGGGALQANHLYLATIQGRGVKASTAVTLLVRGAYTIQ